MLLELRRTLEQMEIVDGKRQAAAEEVSEVLGKLQNRMQKTMEKDMHEKAVGVLGAIDYQEVLTGVPQGRGGGAAPEPPAGTGAPPPPRSRPGGGRRGSGKERK